MNWFIVGVRRGAVVDVNVLRLISSALHYVTVVATAVAYMENLSETVQFANKLRQITNYNFSILDLRFFLN